MRTQLLACPTPGARVHIGLAGMCLIALSKPLSATLNGLSTLATTFTVPYADFAVAECLVAGGYADLCVKVQLPLTSTTQGAVAPLVAIFAPSAATSRGRRLLGMDDALLTAVATVEATNATDRAAAKSLVQWTAACAYVAAAHNLTGMFDCATLSMPLGLSSLTARLAARPWWLWDLLRVLPPTRPLTVVPHAIYKTLFTGPQKPVSPPPRSSVRRRKLLQAPAINLTAALGDARLLGALTENPFSNLVSFASLTAVYYQRGVREEAGVVCNDTGWLACGSFRLPPRAVNYSYAAYPVWARALDALLYLPTMGNGGLAVVDALTSDMPYNVSVAGDYITGRRLVADLSTCNRTALTLGADKPRNILAVLLVASTFIATLCFFCQPGQQLSFGPLFATHYNPTTGSRNDAHHRAVGRAAARLRAVGRLHAVTAVFPHGPPHALPRHLRRGAAAAPQFLRGAPCAPAPRFPIAIPRATQPSPLRRPALR